MTSLRAFIVEDNPTVRASLIGTLRELAHVDPVGQADSEGEAARWLRENAARWDLAVVDLFLKEGSGLGVLQGCKARAPHQRVVILTNYATPAIRAKAAELGADAVFDKSTELDGLLAFCLSGRSTWRGVGSD